MFECVCLYISYIFKISNIVDLATASTKMYLQSYIHIDGAVGILSFVRISCELLKTYEMLLAIAQCVIFYYFLYLSDWLYGPLLLELPNMWS